MEEPRDESSPMPPVPPPGGGSEGPGDGQPSSVWAPPDAGQTHGQVHGAGQQPSGDTHVAVDRDGPPPPPFVRERRRRRRNVLLGLAVLVVVGTPIGLAIGGVLSDDGSQEVAGGELEDGDRSEGPDAPNDGGDSSEDAPETTLEPPDLTELDGTDAVYGQLLVDIDASEEAMLGFQQDLAETFGGIAPGGEGILEAIQEVAEERRSELLEVRDRLSGEVADDGAEAVRDSYVLHLDAWSDYMEAIAEDPSILAADDGSAGYNIAINSTADTFARTLEERLPEDADAEVRAYADGILDRGFRGGGEAQV